MSQLLYYKIYFIYFIKETSNKLDCGLSVLEEQAV